MTKVATAALPPIQRPRGIALGSAGIFAGTALALPLGPALGDAASLTPLLLTDAAVATAAALALTVTLKPASLAATRGTGIRAVWRDPQSRRLAGVAFLGFGVFVALTTWLQALLEPAGIDDTTAGWLLAAMVVAGVIASATLPPRIVERGHERAFLRLAATVAAAGCLTLALAPGAAALAVIPLGIVLLSALPVILELTERRAPAAAATALVWLAGNAGGIVVAVIVQSVSGHPGAAFTLLAATAALVLALV